MPKIKITNPRNVIEAPIKKNYFKIRATSGPKGDKGDTGATGPQGPQGPQGNAATIYVGSTTTLPVGQDATVENVGSQYAAVLNFGIPQGPQGPQGAKGDKGDKGDKGEQGNTGNTGPAGQNATVYIGTTTTGAPGSQASVYNSGTENNAVLNFTIPQGQKGDTGATGATGPQGPAGQDGKDFAPSVVDSLPAVGEENKLYLTPKAHTTQTASGNPITATITDDAGQIEDFQLDGDTYQQSYEGKNLLNLKDNLKTSDRGLDFSFSDNKLVVSGTPTTTYANVTDKIDVDLPAGDYTLSISNAINHRVYLAVDYDDSTTDSLCLINADSTSRTATFAKRAVRIRLDFSLLTVGTALNESLSIQLETGSTATSYEPYVGGIASPNPSYPQPIQVVTGEQTVSKVGKNLFDKNKALDNYFYTSTGSKSIYSRAQFYNNEFVSTSNKITMSFSASHDKQNGSNIEANVRIVQYDASGNFISRLMSRTNGYTFTLDANTKSFILSIDNGPDAWFDDLQVEYGSTVSAYAPYNKQTLTISLGSIELCRLGAYQDYIYKDGDTWKVHKATFKHQFDGLGDSWNYNSTTHAIQDQNYSIVQTGSVVFDVPGVALSREFTYYPNTGGGITTRIPDGCFGFQTTGQYYATFKNDAVFTSKENAIAWLRTNKPTAYWALATPTDTEITDTTLISQLNAIASASLETGTNTLTNSATGSNLAGDMEVDYFGYDPTNRYDKWLWLDINNAYEKLGS